MASSAPGSTRRAGVRTGGARSSRATATQGDTSTDGMAYGHIVRHTAGRMRIWLHQQHRDLAALETIEDQGDARGGACSVVTNARAVSALVQYDHREAGAAEWYLARQDADSDDD